MDLEFNIFPWEKGEKPYFINEKGFEWYVDKDMTNWARKDMPGGTKGIKDVMCFYVKMPDGVTRVLIDDKQNIIHEDTNLEGMASHIDMMKISKRFEE